VKKPLFNLINRVLSRFSRELCFCLDESIFRVTGSNFNTAIWMKCEIIELLFWFFAPENLIKGEIGRSFNLHLGGGEEFL
jgi:hypothetical protein